MLDSDVGSPLAAVVVGSFRLRTGQLDGMASWLSHLAQRFPYLPDGPVLWAEWRLRTTQEPRLPEEVVLATLSLLDRGLPLTNDALGYAARQVDGYLLAYDLDASTRERLMRLRERLVRAFRFFRSGGVFCTFAATERRELTPKLVRSD